MTSRRSSRRSRPIPFAAIAGALATREVALALPKFGIETKTDLASTLAALGMPTAFDDRADFSGITTAEPLEISDVIHQANIDVDEKGTEAAAATAVVIRATGMPAEPVTSGGGSALPVRGPRRADGHDPLPRPRG